MILTEMLSNQGKLIHAKNRKNFWYKSEDQLM